MKMLSQNLTYTCPGKCMCYVFLIFNLCFVFTQMSSTNRTLINAFREIGAMADRINLPKTLVVS